MKEQHDGRFGRPFGSQNRFYFKHDDFHAELMINHWILGRYDSKIQLDAGDITSQTARRQHGYSMHQAVTKCHPSILATNWAIDMDRNGVTAENGNF